MQHRTGLKIVGMIGLLAIAVAVVACTSGVAQEEYDAVKQQVTAKEQEAATAKQQITSLQRQLQPAAPREPKRLEAKITLHMGETLPDKMWFATPEGVKGGPFRVSAGKEVGIHFVNVGEKKHEFFFGRTPATVEGRLDGYEVNLFEEVDADVFVYAQGKMVEIGGAHFEEIEVEPGTETWIRVVFPAELKGEWEFGCFIYEPGEEGHYQQGMHAKLMIE